MTNLVFYKELRSIYVSQLVNEIDTTFQFIFEDNISANKLKAFYSQYLPIFNNDDEEFHHRLINNEKFMTKMPAHMVKLVFAIFCSKDSKK